jgi:hypothetical protein
MTEWAEVPDEFGADMPNGSCNAMTTQGGTPILCGWPRRPDGTCMNPKESHKKEDD